MTLSQAILKAAEQGLMVSFHATPPNCVSMQLHNAKGNGVVRHFEERHLANLPDAVIARELVRSIEGLHKYAQEQGDQRIINITNGRKQG